MRKFQIILGSLALITTGAFAQLREVKNDAFQRGEYLKYKVYYESLLTGKVVAGTAIFEIKTENKLISGRSTYHVTVVGKTLGAFSWFFKVVDRYETYIDETAIAPWLFIRRVDEGDYIINQDVTFNQSKNVAYFKDNKNGRTANVATPAYCQDLLSAIYYMRTYNFSSAKANEELAVKFLLDDTVYSTKVHYLGKQTLNVGIGTVSCLKLKPQVLTGTVFKDPYPVMVWASDDKNKVPVLAESEVIVGKVRMELVEYSGLKNSFTALIK